MAQFKIILLNLKNAIHDSFSKPQFFGQCISEFYNSYNVNEYYRVKDKNSKEFLNGQSYSLINNQTNDLENQKNSFCYTYNENFRIEQNAQKTLTFNMDRFVMRDNRREENPFVRNIYVGSQLVLIDKYDWHHLLTVKSIDFDFQEENLVYKYSCQDSFSFQLSRQNDGYTIENDPSSEDFIGAKEIDWWVINKIHPECYISYDYIPLNQKTNVKRAYTKDSNPDYFIPFCFSGSGTANSLLISLGNEIGLRLQVYEHWDENTHELTTEYWFEPIKNPLVSGLKYSPYQNIKTFSLSHKGDALSSVFNVQTHKVGEDMISLLPPATPFFRTLFTTTDVWNNSQFSKGYFTSVCQGQTEHYVWGHSKFCFKEGLAGYRDVIIDNNKPEWNTSELLDAFTNRQCVFSDSYLFIPFYPSFGNFIEDRNTKTIQGTFQLSPFYQNFTFCTSSSNSVLSHKQGEELSFLSYGASEWRLILINENEAGFTFTPGVDPLLLNDTFKGAFICIQTGNRISREEVFYDSDFWIYFYRDASVEDLEFAKIADTCPWLENKLIDFSYFLSHSLISPKMFNVLNQQLINDLRKINGRLLAYSQQYYQALHSKTELLSKITNKIDLLGARFQADILDAFVNTGQHQAQTDFMNIYASLFLPNDSSGTGVIDYAQTVNSYWTKYINAEQRFLKNIYNFRNYFNQPKTFFLNQYTITGDENSNYFISLGNKPALQKITSSFQYYNKNITSEDYGKIYTTVYKNTPQGNYEVLSKDVQLDTFKAAELINKNCLYMLKNSNEYIATSRYDPKMTYYEQIWYVDIDKSVFSSTIDALKEHDGGTIGSLTSDNNWTLSYLSHTEKWVLKHQEHIINNPPKTDVSYIIKPFDTTLQFRITFSKIETAYEKVTLLDMLNNFFTNQGDGFALDAYYKTSLQYNSIHNENEDIDTKWWTKTDDLNISPWVFEHLRNARNWSQDIHEKLQNENFITAWELYIENFANTKVFYKQGLEQYKETTLVNIENAGNFYRRIASGELAKKTWISTLITRNLFPSALLLPYLTLGSCMLSWKHINSGFDNSGWSFYDIENNLITPFSSFPHPEDYQRKIFTRTSSSYENLEFNEWGSLQAYEILLTYLGLAKGPLTQEEANNEEIEDKTEFFDTTFYYQTNYWEFLGPDSIINDIDTYYTIACVDGKNPFVNPISRKAVLAETKYYPVKNLLNVLDFSHTQDKDAALKTQHSYVLETAMYALDIFISYADESSSLLNFTLSDGSTYQGYIIRLRKYEPIRFKKPDTLEKIQKYTTYTWYSTSTNLPIKWEDQFNCTLGFYTLQPSKVIDTQKELNYIQLTNLADFDLSNRYFKKDDNGFHRLYTISNLIESRDYYYLTSTSKIINYINRELSNTDPIIIKPIVYEKNSTNGEWKKLNNIDPIKITYIGPRTMDITQNGQALFSYKLETERSYFIENKTLTNGEFWYLYHNNSWTTDEDAKQARSFLSEEAMFIETSLTEFWNNAYTASKNCRFFLPEHWQQEINNNINPFYGDIIALPAYNRGVKLKNIYIPEVKIIPNQIKFQFDCYESLMNSLQQASIDEASGLSLNSTYSLENISKNIKPINDMVQYLGLDNSNLKIIGTGIQERYTYYQHVSGGQMWKDVLSLLTDNSIQCDHFGGWYDMMLKVLLNCNYYNRDLEQYNQALQEHNDLWRKIYTSYPNIVLEKQFTNENATTSTELFESAQRAFRDYLKIEADYSITTIDLQSLKGYTGQEIRIGDAIEIETQEYYDEWDDLKNSLQQYLFITDISYDLRNDANVQLTVNEIKYQDKLIGELIHLIR